MNFPNNRFLTWKTVTLVIDDRTGKVLSIKKEKHKQEKLYYKSF